MNQPWSLDRAFAPTAPPPPATPAIVPDLLARYGALARDALAARLARPNPAPFLDVLVADYPSRPGKMMRPAITIAAARAFGGQTESALPLAVAIELFHNALLIHDDIEDESEVRRGRPTLHALHGTALALNAGDATMLVALSALAEGAAALLPSVARAILAQAERMARETAEGQALELGWRADPRISVTEADYLTMVLKKTGWMSLIFPLQAGALASGAPAVDLDALARFGFFLGAAFQVQDDLLNLVADGRYGKERLGDLMEGKRTLMAIRLAADARPEIRATTGRWLETPRAARTTAMIEEIHALMEECGAIAHARAVAHGLAGAAAHEFATIAEELPPSPDRAFLAGLVSWVFERT
jgi:geranylgeranyl diphosphate synthase type II